MDCFPRRRFLRGVGASIVGGLAVGPLLSALGATTKTRFGWQPTLNGARYFIAHDQGLFSKNGVEGNGSVESQVNERVRQLCARFPIYQG